MDGMPDDADALRREQLRQLNEVLGPNGRASHGEHGYAFQIEWLTGPTDPYTGFYGHTVHPTFESAMESAKEAARWPAPQSPPDGPRNG